MQGDFAISYSDIQLQSTLKMGGKCVKAPYVKVYVLLFYLSGEQYEQVSSIHCAATCSWLTWYLSASQVKTYPYN